MVAGHAVRYTRDVGPRPFAVAGRPIPITRDVSAIVNHTSELDASESGGPAEGEETRHVGPDPIVELTAQFVGFVELHHRGLPGIFIRDERFDARHPGC